MRCIISAVKNGIVLQATSLCVIVKNTTARTKGLVQTNTVSDICVEHYVAIDQTEKVQDLIDSLQTNPADSIRIGLDLNSVAKIIKHLEPSKPYTKSLQLYMCITSYIFHYLIMSGFPGAYSNHKSAVF